MKKSIAVLLATLGLLFVGASSASAGEVNGHGDKTGAYYNSNSECAFSGLEDGDDLPPGSPSGPGATPQNFGQTLHLAADGVFGPDLTTVHAIKAAGFAPGDSCNGSAAGRK